MLGKSRLFGLGFLLLALATVCPAQVEDTPVGDSDMEKAAKKIKLKFEAATSGKDSDRAPTKEEEAALELAAQYYVFRLTWPDYADSPAKMAAAIKEFNKLYKTQIMEEKIDPRDKEKKQYILVLKDDLHRDTVKAFHNALRESFKKVLVERDFVKNRLTSFNVAQLLPVLAKSKTEEISDLLTSLINDPSQHDTVKLIAIHALKEYFPIADPAGIALKAQDVKRVQALTNFIERKWDMKGAPPEELAAVAWLRRDAIRCLGQAQTAAVGYQKMQVHGQIACTLLRVLAKDTLEPPPTLHEKCLAAFALCNIKTPVRDARNPARDYDPDMAIYAVGKTLGQFIDEYRKDLQYIKPKEKGPQLPWKSLSEEWEDSLARLAANTKSEKADKLQKQTAKLLEAIRGYAKLPELAANDFINVAIPKLKTAEKIPFREHAAADGKSLEVELHYE